MSLSKLIEHSDALKKQNLSIAKLLRSKGAFLAFSDSEFEKKKKEGVNYYRNVSGLAIPLDSKEEVETEMSVIRDLCHSELVSEIGKENIIRMLFETCDSSFIGNRVETCCQKAEYYGISREDVLDEIGAIKIENA